MKATATPLPSPSWGPDPPPGMPPPQSPLGLHTGSGLPRGVQAHPPGTPASRDKSPSSLEAPASKWGATWCVEGPTRNEGPWGHRTRHRGRQPHFTPPAHQRGPSMGSTRTRTRLPRGGSRKRGKSVHPGGRAAVPRGSSRGWVQMTPWSTASSACGQQGPRHLVVSAVPAPEIHKPPGGSAKRL